MERFERLSEMSRRFGVYFRNKFSSKDSLLNDLDKKFTSFSRTPLHIASINGNVKLAKQILSVRSDLARKQDLNGFTPLHLASARTSLEMVRLLIKAYPDACKVQNKDGKTPLHVAAMKDRVEIMKLLTEEGRFEALLLNNYQNGETILHFCVKNNSSLGTLDLLVHKLVLALHTSDLCTIINSKDSDGNTVLHAAAEMRKFEIVNYLLQRDNIEIDLDAVNNKGLKSLNVLSEAQRDDLELGFYVFSGDTKERTNETLSEKKDHCYQVINKKSPKKRSHKERVNVLLVVSTLIAGIAFQAMSNPPGGVWQEDSKLESGTDPVQFAYYVGLMFDSSISGSLLSYTQDHMLPNDSTSNTSTTTEWKGYSKAQENVYYFMSNLLYNTTRHSTYKGLIVEDSTSATISDYNRSDGSDKFFPYLIRYAGFPIMAYQNPFAYEIYILVNTIAFSLSLTVVFAVICGFVHDKSVAQNRILIMLMCISIGCISVSYLAVLESFTPDFFSKDQGLYSLLIYFSMCCICGIGLFLWRFISRMVQLKKKHLTAFNYFKALFTMDARAAGKVALFILGLCAFYWTLPSNF